MLGLTAIGLLFVMLPVTWGVAIGFQSEVALFVLGGGTLLMAFVAAILGLVLGIFARKSGAWAVVGIVTSALAPLLALAALGTLILLDG